jgi:hypothetical protein
MTDPVLPCPRHGPTHACLFQDKNAGPCSGQVRGYYLDWYVLVHCCEGHLAHWDTLVADDAATP